MNLKKYQKKRDFNKTPEPKPIKKKKQNKELRFVIQKHAARRLHYDFRLEVGGVLKSWAVPKGPSLNPKDKRLAVMTEDHPYDYKDFEGVIPEGYGAGEVIIWDQGTYDTTKEDFEGALKKGEITFFLHGEKLKGVFALARIDDEKNEWLLIKKKDEYASTQNVLTDDRSVVSHVSIEELSMPHHLLPMYAQLIDAPFDDKEWIFEIKLDGFRAIAEVNRGKVELYSRNLQSFNERFSPIQRDLAKIKTQAIFDGEIVVMDDEGRPQFQLIQNYSNRQEGHLKYFIFDLLYFDGKDLRDLPLIERKKILKKAFKKIKGSHLEYLDHVDNEGVKFYSACMEHELEGILAKRKKSLYLSGERTRDWLKIKREMRQEAIVCGYTVPKGGRKHIGALVLGLYKEGELVYIGHVGGGYTDQMLKDLKKLFVPYVTDQNPFKHFPKKISDVTWMKPHFLCEVKFSEWTDEGLMRQPIFLGLREDKKATEVVEEKPLEKQKFTHTEKVYWPDEGITKGQMLSFYEQIGPTILPYLKDRPQSLRRYPDGINGEHFFQKNLIYYPKWLKTKKIQHHHKVDNYLVITDISSLLYEVNLGCIELHPFFSRIQSLDFPDFLVLDLDPVEIPFEAVIEVANGLHEIVEELGIEAYPKTSGSRGIHICVPLGAKYTYEQAKNFAHLLATLGHKKMPKITSLERSPKDRRGKVYIDFLQNNPMQTIAAPYSLRAKPGAPVSAPLEWKEIKKGLHPLDFTIFNMEARIKKKGDLYKGVLGKGVEMEKVLKKLS